MLLGRNANGLFWMSRYIERTENMARLIDAGLRMALTRTSSAAEEWASVIASAGADAGFREKHDTFTAETVADYVLRDKDNQSSVMSSIENGRINARMVRTALTRESWEAINDGWMIIKKALTRKIDERDIPRIIDVIKRETAQIRGAIYGTQLRNEIFDFAQAGTYVERADNTARILDVKYYVLLPSISWVGSTLDTSQWESILRSVSAHRSYRWVYDAEYSSANIADYLILNGRMPRSLSFCNRMISEHLGFLERDYGERHACHATADELGGRLKGSIKQVFDAGLHEFLSDYISGNNRLGAQIAEDYKFNA